MGPRSKSNRVEFTGCSECGCQFSSKDANEHMKHCTDVSNVDNLPHGFIHNRILRGTLKYESPPDHLPKHYWPHVVLLHPNAMLLCDIQMGAPVIVHGCPTSLPRTTPPQSRTIQECESKQKSRSRSHKVGVAGLKGRSGPGSGQAAGSDDDGFIPGSEAQPIIMVAWPNPSAPLASAALVSSRAEGPPPSKCNGRLTVASLHKPYIPALEVHFKLSHHHTFSKSADFLSYVHRWCKDRGFLTRGGQVDLFYCGQPCHLVVTDIKADEEEEMLAQCGSQLEKLSLCSEKTPADTVVDPGVIGIQKSGRPAVTFYQILENTKFLSMEQLSPEGPKPDERINLGQVGGMEEQIKSLKELIDLHFKQKQPIQKGLWLPKGILIHGPSGTGKTLLSHALMTYAGVSTSEIQGSDVWSRYYGESESRLAAKFEETRQMAPCILFLDDLDALCPRRGSSQNEVEKRVVASLMTLMDKTLSAPGPPIVIIAATNKLDQIDPSLRRPGRLDREVELGVPGSHDRRQILSRLMQRFSHRLSIEDIQQVADRAHGFVGADLAAVCKEAGIHALLHGRESTSEVVLEDLVAGLAAVQPSAMREVALEIPEVMWNDIGGQEQLKHKLRQAIEWPLLHPESFARLGLRPPRGLLMYGPPGCSKTMVAKALARESGVNFIAIKGPELFSKWVGESERAVREVFRKARAAAPAIVFFDEIDSIAGERGSHGGSGGGEVGDRVLAQLLTEIDGVVALQDVTVVAATNRPDRIDKALLRPGRLDRIVYVPLPDSDTRQQIFNIRFRSTPTAKDVDVDWLVASTERFSGAEVSAVCHEAALAAMQEDVHIEKVHRRHFEAALKTVTPRIPAEQIDFYEHFAKTSGLHAI